MVKIDFKTLDSQHRIQAAQKALGGAYSSHCDEMQVTSENDIDSYLIRSLDMDEGIKLLLVEFKNYNVDVCLEYGGYEANPLELIFVKKGTALIQENGVLAQTLEADQSLIYASPESLPYSIIIPSDTDTHIVIIEIIRDQYLEKIECDIDSLHKSVQLLLTDIEGLKPYMHTDKIGFNSANAISTIIKTNTEGLERKLILESATKRLIANFITMIRKYLEPINNNYKFDKVDISLIEDVKDIIESSPSKTFTVNELSKKVGLNPNKLQKGFKINYGMTIRQYVIKNKLKFALKRLEKEDARIGDIVIELGYTNAGHFTALFSKEFGMLPSEYRKIIAA